MNQNEIYFSKRVFYLIAVEFTYTTAPQVIVTSFLSVIPNDSPYQRPNELLSIMMNASLMKLGFFVIVVSQIKTNLRKI